MNTVGGFFIEKNESATCKKENVITGKKYRFTVLTDRLIRLEYNPNGVFEDRATQRVIYRNFPKVEFQASQSELLLQISTAYFNLDYVKEKPLYGGKVSPSSNFKITLKQTDRVWHYNHPEARNFGGIGYSLDNFSGSLKFDKGLYSTDGFAVMDDSDSLVLDGNGNFVARENKGIDIYVFMYKKDFGLCLQDYYTLTGYPMLISRYALGTWWYKNSKYTGEELNVLLNNFREEKINVSALMLGDKWHPEGDPLVFDEKFLNENTYREIANRYQVKTGLTTDISKKVKMNTYTYQNVLNSLQDLKDKEYSFLPLSSTSFNLYSTYGIRNLINTGFDSFVVDYNNIKDKNVIALLNHYYYAMGSMLFNKRLVVFSIPP